jgi:hypothetical protein
MPQLLREKYSQKIYTSKNNIMNTTMSKKDDTFGCNYLPNWAPGQDIIISIEDELKTPRTQEEINAMFDVLKCAARNSGFDLQTWGLRPHFEKAIEKSYIRAKIRETVEATRLQIIQLDPEKFKFLETANLFLPEVYH